MTAIKSFFKELAPEVHSMGYSLIPIQKRQKTPQSFMSNWQHYSSNLPTEEEIDDWCLRAPGSNIALVCGKASNIIVIDIDDNDLVYNSFIPKSPLVRKGKKGEARFFQWNKDLENFSVAGRLDFLVNNKYILIPPSVHPETGQEYYWSGQFKSLCPASELPELTVEAVERIKDNLDKNRILSKISGRNNKLKAVASACLMNHKSVDETIDEVIFYDETYHSNQLFKDVDEPYFKKTRDQREAARIFVESIAKSLNVEISDELPIIEMPTQGTKEDTIINFPKPMSNMLNKIYSTVMSKAEYPVDSIALISALGVVSGMIGNRFAFKNTNGQVTCGNLYQMVLAPTGFGKNLAYKTVNQITERLNIVESIKKTGTALVTDLSSNRERLYLVDEMSLLFEGMSGKNISVEKSALEDVLNHVFSQADDFSTFTSSNNSKKDGIKTRVANAHVSIVGASTKEKMLRVLSRSIITSGLLPRFLMFNQTAGDMYGRDSKNPFFDFTDDLKHEIKIFSEQFPIERDKSLVPNELAVKFRYLVPSKEASDFLVNEKYFEHEFKKEQTGAHSWEVDFQVRRCELIIKLAMIDAISDGNYHTVELHNLLWARSVFNFHIDSIKTIVPNLVSLDIGELKMQVLSYVKDKQVVTARDVLRKFRSLNAKIRNEIILDLVLGENIVKKEAKNDLGRPSVTYYFKSWF
jgi:hypothetical protein